VIAVLVLIIGGYAFDYWSSAKLEDTWKQYSAATKGTEPQKWDDLKTVATKAKGTRPAMFAAVSLGDHYFAEAKKASLKGDAGPSGAKGAADAQTVAASAAEWYS